jgi:signal transduction histidine kinase
MNENIDFINTEGLKFFGKVNASISHELKNILAIISETSGFLNDLTDLAKQGKELKLSLLESCNDSIAEEIQRGFTTIKQMNQFAHIVDIPIREIDLLEILKLTIHLSGFLSFANKVQIKDIDQELLPVLTNPFLFQNMIYQILCFAYESTGPDGEISFNFISPEKDGVHLIISSPAQLALKEFPTQKIQKAANILGLEFKKTASPMELDIWIPYVSNNILALAKEFKMES